MFACDAHIRFKVIDFPFYRSSYFIEGIPFGGIALDTWKHAQFHVFISISGSSLLSGAAGFFAVTDPLSFNHMDFGAAPFGAVRASFFFRGAAVLHGKGSAIGVGRIAIIIETDFLEGAFITGIVRNQGLLETEVIYKEAINIGGIKSGIPQEGIRMEIRVGGEKVGKDRFQGGGVRDGFIFFRGIRFFLNRKFGMVSLKVSIKENNIPDDAETIGKDAELIGIAEMSIDIHLFCVRGRDRSGRHEAIGHLVRIHIRIILIESLKSFDEGIEGLGVIFGDKEFNAGGIKSKDVCEGRINEPTDGFCEINHVSEHKFNKRLKVLTEPGKEGGVGDFREAAEIPEFPADGKEKDEEGVGRDRKELL